VLCCKRTLDNNADQVFMSVQRAASCRSTARCNNGGENTSTSVTTTKMRFSRAVPSQTSIINDNSNENVSSKFNRNRTMTLPARHRSRSSPSNRSSHAVTDHSPQQHRSLRHEPEAEMVDSTPEPDVTVYRVRTFTTKSGNVVNRGDSIKIRNRGVGRNEAGKPSLTNTGVAMAHAIRRSSSSDTRLSSPGSKTAAGTAAGSMSARERGDLSRNTSRGALSYVSADDVQFPLSPSPSICVVATMSSEQPLLETAAGDNETRDRGQVLANEGQRNNSNHRNTNDNGMMTYNDPPVPLYRVLVLGSQGVGKTTLVEQLMTSEYLANKENCTAGQYKNFQLSHVNLN